MLLIATVESAGFRELVSKIPAKAGPQSRKTFSKYLDIEYAKMEDELKNKLDELEIMATVQ